MSQAPRRLTRGRFLVAAGSATVAASGVGASRLIDGRNDDAIPFDGAHQAGIVTPVQDRLFFASFDVVTEDRTELRDLLRTWSAAGRRLAAGRLVGERNELGDAPPDDTGEAYGLDPARLTVTIGLGPSLFDDRFGLAPRRPPALEELPPFPGDVLDAQRSGGDLAVQACADDPQVAFHAVRNLTRLGRGAVVMRWSQLGFGKTSTTSPSADTPRNLMGFKDGTNNIKRKDARALARDVWVAAPDSPRWLHGGSYLVVRRIRMLIETWDRASLADQEQTIGRHKYSGAPLGGTAEHETVDLVARNEDGTLAIPTTAHIRLAGPDTNDGTRLLRRGYSFTDGMDERLGQLDAGLFFISYQRHPDAFIRVQQRLAQQDALNEYIKHTGSGVFACPPGARGPGDYVGSGLFA